MKHHLDPFAGDRVPVTYAHRDLLDARDDDPRRQRFLARNMRKLAKLMRRLPKERHDQGSFANSDGQHACKTTACALGWAAMTHLIPGLQYDFDQTDVWGDEGEKETNMRFVQPMMNGKKVDWDTAGAVFFGDEALHDIFWNPSLDRYTIADELERRANELAPRRR